MISALSDRLQNQCIEDTAYLVQPKVKRLATAPATTLATTPATTQSVSLAACNDSASCDRDSASCDRDSASCDPPAKRQCGERQARGSPVGLPVGLFEPPDSSAWCVVRRRHHSVQARPSPVLRPTSASYNVSRCRSQPCVTRHRRPSDRQLVVDRLDRPVERPSLDFNKMSQMTFSAADCRGSQVSTSRSAGFSLATIASSPLQAVSIFRDDEIQVFHGPSTLLYDDKRDAPSAASQISGSPPRLSGVDEILDAPSWPASLPGVAHELGELDLKQIELD